MRPETRKKLLILLVIVAALGLSRVLHLDELLSLSSLKASQGHLIAYYHHHPALALAAYMAGYIAVTAFSIPGAAVLTLAGGAVFGLLAGTVAVSFASTIGASLAFLMARFLLRDWVQERFGERLKAVHRGMEAEGPFYLFSLRLVPVFPFFVINLLMGLTRMPVRTFFWVSQVGMLPGTVIYVNAGRELGRIDSLSGILSPRLILALVLLGLFPIAVKRLVGFYRAKTGRHAPGSAPAGSPDHGPGGDGGT